MWKDAVEQPAIRGLSILGRLPEANLPLIEPTLRGQIGIAQGLSALDLQQASRMCRVLSARPQDYFKRYDLLLTPTVPIPAFEAGKALHNQFSTSNALTRRNSCSLFVTTVHPFARACAAIHRSLLPMMRPCFSNSARIWP